MDLSTLVNRAQRLAGRVDSGWDSRTVQFIQEGVDEWARKRPWRGLRKTEDVVAVGTRTQTFPSYMMLVLHIGDKQNRRALTPTDSWDREDPTSYFGDTAGTPSWWREIGTMPLYRQPGAASDTPSYLDVRADANVTLTMHIRGLTVSTAHSGTPEYLYEVEEQLALAGTGATSTYQYVTVTSLGKSALTDGPIEIWGDPGMLGRIAPQRYNSQYRQVEFLDIPAAGLALRIHYLEYPGALTTGYQQPHPSISPEYLAWFAAGLIHTAQGEPELAAQKTGRAMSILDSRSDQENSQPDRDNQLRPDFDYWNWNQDLEF